MSLKECLQSMRTLCTGRGFCLVAIVTSLRELNKCFTAATSSILIYSSDIVLCIFVQHRTFSGEARAKEYGRPF